MTEAEKERAMRFIRFALGLLTFAGPVCYRDHLQETSRG